MVEGDVKLSTFKASDGSNIKFEYHRMLTSTAELARKYASEGYDDRFVVFTDAQSSSAITGTKLADGEYERGVFISILLRPAFFPSQASLIGHLAAVGLISALEEHTTLPLGLGWVSDVYCNGIRIGGCNVEGKLNSFSSYEYLIVTMAVKLTKETFPPRLSDMIRRVFESDNAPISMLIAKTIVNKFFAAYSSIRSPGKYLDAYYRKFAFREKKIKYLDGERKRSCKVLDVDKSSGMLIIEMRGGEKMEITSPSKILMPKKIK